MGVESDEVNAGGLPTTFVCEYGYAEGTPNAGLFLGCSAMDVKNGPDVYQGYEDILGGVNTPVSGLGAFAFWHTRLPDAGPLDGGSLTVYFGSPVGVRTPRCLRRAAGRWEDSSTSGRTFDRTSTVAH